MQHQISLLFSLPLLLTIYLLVFKICAEHQEILDICTYDYDQSDDARNIPVPKPRKGYVQQGIGCIIVVFLWHNSMAEKPNKPPIIAPDKILTYDSILVKISFLVFIETVKFSLQKYHLRNQQ